MKTRMPMLRIMASKGMLRIFCALLLVVVIMFLSNYIVYKNSIQSIYKQVSENNRLVVNNVIRSFDNSFKKINDIIYSVQMLPYNAWDEIDSGSIDMHDAYMMQKNIGTLISSVNYIEDVVVFHKNSSLAITSTGTIHLPELFAIKYIHPIYNAEYWYSLASSEHPLKMMPTQYFGRKTAGAEAPGRKLLTVLGNNQISELNIMVFIDLQKLLSEVNQISMMQGTSLFLLDENQTMILNTEDDWNMVGLLSDLRIDAAQESTVQRKDYEYYVFKSEYNGFTYINKSPREFANLEAVSTTNQSIMLVSILSAIALSLLLSHFLYKPVQNILKLFGGRLGTGPDYPNIKREILRLQEANDEAQRRLASVHEDMRRNYFLRALDDHSDSLEFELQGRSYFGELLPLGQFIMLSVTFRPKEDQVKHSHVSPEELLDCLQTGLSQRLEHVVLFHEAGLTFIGLISLRQASHKENAMNRVRSFLVSLQNKSFQNFGIIAAASRVYISKISNCRLAYKDIVRCYSERNLTDEGPLFDIQSIRPSFRVHLAPQEIERLSYSIMTGNKSEAERLVSEMLDANLKLDIQYHQLLSIAESIFYGMMKHFPSSTRLPAQQQELEATFRRKLELSVDFKTVRELLVASARTIASQHEETQTNKLNRAAIAEYIDKHYMDNLHLEHMAELLETSPKYFSNYFKKHFGVNFVEYLNKVRLSNASEYLRKTDLSITEIGERTGYLNATTFTSTFKKYYGVSPSEYRKNPAM